MKIRTRVQHRRLARKQRKPQRLRRRRNHLPPRLRSRCPTTWSGRTCSLPMRSFTSSGSPTLITRRRTETALSRNSMTTGPSPRWILLLAPSSGLPTWCESLQLRSKNRWRQRHHHSTALPLGHPTTPTARPSAPQELHHCTGANPVTALHLTATATVSPVNKH